MCFSSFQDSLPKRVKIIHVLERGLHGSQFGNVLFGRPSGVPVESGRKRLEKVFFALALRRHVVVEGGIHAVERSPLHGV